MRIMLWSESLPPYVGGVERSASLLLPELKQRGFDFTLVTNHHFLEAPDEGLFFGMPLHRFHFANSLSQHDLPTYLQEQKRLEALVAATQPQLLHIFMIGPSMMAGLHQLKRRPVPLLTSLVTVEHDAETTFAPHGIIGQTLLHSTRIITVSRALRAQAVACLPALAARTEVLHYGYPSPTIELAPLAAPPRLLLLGRLVPQKGAAMAVKAFARIHQRYPAARLIVAGDGPERADLEELARPMGDQVEFTGWVAPEDVAELLNRVTVVLMPSRWEGLPLIALETATMARPIIATRIPGMDEIVVDGETGLLVAPEDDAQMAAAITILLDNPARAAQMGRAAQVRVQQDFGFTRYVDEHATLYRQLLESA